MVKRFDLLLWFVDLSTSTSCFNCKGQLNVSNKQLVEREKIYLNSTTFDCENQSDHLILFGYSFHKGHSLVYDIPLLFRMAKYVYYFGIYLFL